MNTATTTTTTTKCDVSCFEHSDEKWRVESVSKKRNYNAGRTTRNDETCSIYRRKKKTMISFTVSLLLQLHVPIHQC
jgi:hypothetical protein